MRNSRGRGNMIHQNSKADHHPQKSTCIKTFPEIEGATLTALSFLYSSTNTSEGESVQLTYQKAQFFKTVAMNTRWTLLDGRLHQRTKIFGKHLKGPRFSQKDSLDNFSACQKLLKRTVCPLKYINATATYSTICRAHYTF